MQTVIGMLREEVSAKLATHPPTAELIVQDPKLLFGKPTVFGTRLSVELLLEGLAGGRTPEQLMRSYPTLYPEGLEAAIAFAEGLPAMHPLAGLLAQYRALCR
ncbi:DUF433 domain-containing protein [Gloeobacter violaceus]|nr:DUF433 domain-containing protein [Gloeobacter violaceus]